MNGISMAVAVMAVALCGCAQRGDGRRVHRSGQVQALAAETKPIKTAMGMMPAPSLTAYLPEGGSNGMAVIVCPGGGYHIVMDTYEGEEVCRWWAQRGVAAFLLRYRIAPDRYPAALDDVRAAVRLVREHAREYGVDPRRVGVMGFSAGGHLAGCAMTMWTAPEERPDFGVLVYPVISLVEPWGHLGSRDNLLGKDFSPGLDGALSLQHRVTRATPPCFLVHGNNDRVVSVNNSQMVHDALKQCGVQTKLVLLDDGPHGFGLKGPWPEAMLQFLQAVGALPRQPTQPTPLQRPHDPG